MPKNMHKIPLPKSWPCHVRSAVLHIIALAQYATVYTRSWASNSLNARVRLRAENDRLRQEVALLEEEIRIKDARMQMISPRKRPHFPPTQRMAILELRTARDWSLQTTANTFHLTAATVASWMKRLDEEGPNALVQLRTPANKFPDFVRYAVQRLRRLCPSMGKVKIAQVLARAGLHLGSTTVGRMLDEPTRSGPSEDIKQTSGTVTADRPNHVWHIDLTTVPMTGGFWAPWLPFSLPQWWPHCWWVAVVMDHFSRRVMGTAIFRSQPNSIEVQKLLEGAIHQAQVSPKHLICDKGTQFCCDAFKAWCHQREITPRYGAVGRHGSIAVIERFMGTMKREATRRLLVSSRSDLFRNELQLFIDWYNESRPHSALNGRTPNEAYFDRAPANRRPRYEPRPGWPRTSRCAQPQTLVAGQPGAEFTLHVEFVEGRKHLPVVTLKRAA